REAGQGALDVVVNALQTAQSIIKTVKGFMDLFKAGTAGLGNAIPALGIAISGATIAVKAYNIMWAEINKYRMTKIKRDFKDKYGSRDFVKEKKHAIKGFVIRNSKGVDKKKLEDRRTELMNKSSLTDEEQ